MKLKRGNEVSQDYERVRRFLLEHEAYHGLMLGLLDAILNSPERFKQPYIAVVEEDDTVLAVALQTPPRKLLLSRVERLNAIALIAQDLHSIQAQVPGVMGTTAAAQIFAQNWHALTGQSYREGTRERYFQLETVQPITHVTGHLQQATLSERELLINWCRAFMAEVADEPASPDDVVDRYLRGGSLYLWQDNTPVSMANFYGATPNGVRINLVYTPPEYRRKGYATACVAALSQALLERGYKYCFLSTDLANPTSNHIYQVIGYQPLSDEIQEYWFEHSYKMMS
ncbi:MAG: GNAT family N-acetyltransferase [Cyanobacteriota bacterium]